MEEPACTPGSGQGARVSERETLDDILLSLARIRVSEHTVAETLTAVVDLAQRAVPGCDAASVTVIDSGRPMTAVSTDDRARVVDEGQYREDNGPCVDTVQSGEPHRVDDLTADERWPTFRRVAAEHGVASALSLPLVGTEEPLGALNLYSAVPGAFKDAEATAGRFASYVAVTLANATALGRATDLATNLQRALERRDVIGQAKGVIMALEGVTPDEAFDVLRRASQRSNRKLYELAEEVIARRHDQATPDGGDGHD